MAKAFETNEEKVLSSEELETVSGGAGNTGETVIAYYEDGNTEILISQGDGTTFTTLKGAVYYLGEDGVYRSKEYTSLYVRRPVK
jgi:hypothetical protein